MPRSVVAALASSAVLLLGACAAVGPDRPAAPAAAEHFVDSTSAPSDWSNSNRTVQSFLANRQETYDGRVAVDMETSRNVSALRLNTTATETP